MATRFGWPASIALSAGESFTGTMDLYCNEPTMPLFLEYELDGDHRRVDVYLVDPRVGVLQRGESSFPGLNESAVSPLAVGIPDAATVFRPGIGDKETDEPSETTLAGKASLRKVTGSLSYRRNFGNSVGAEGITAFLYDAEPGPDRLLGGSIVDENGNYTINYNWIFEGHPDLYVRFAAENGKVKVKAGVGSGEFGTYRWDTSVIWNSIPTNEVMDHEAIYENEYAAAVHMVVQFTRAWLLFDQVGFGAIPKINVVWPSSDWPHYEGQDQEIHLPQTSDKDSTWADSTYWHEYGHHWMRFFGSSGGEGGYCNAGSRCDTPGEPCRHCAWCQETYIVAWAEGVPDFFADKVTRWVSTNYGHVGGEALAPRDYEEQAKCSSEANGNDDYDPENITEGTISALLRDLDDGGSLDDDKDPRAAGVGEDSSNYSFFSILETILLDGPTSGYSFLADFLERNPGDAATLWSTAFNNGFNIDSTPPSVVQNLTSPSHALGVPSPDATIRFEWDPAYDAMSPGFNYSVWIGPQPQMPDATVDHASAGTLITQPLPPGSYYLSIRALDRAGNWSTSYASHGPVVVRDPEPADLQAGAASLFFPFPLIPHPHPVFTPAVALPTTLNTVSTFLSFELFNSGELPAAGPARIDALLDGLPLDSETLSQNLIVPAGSFYQWYNKGIFVIPAGRHTLTLVGDSLEEMPEQNESDNSFARQWVWSAPAIQAAGLLTTPAPPDPFGGWDPAPLVGSPNCQGFDINTNGAEFVAVSAYAESTDDDYDLRVFPQSASPQSGYLAQSLLAFSVEPAGELDAVFIREDNAGAADWDVALLNSNDLFLVRNESDAHVQVLFSEALTVDAMSNHTLAVDEAMDLFHFDPVGNPGDPRLHSFAIEVDTDAQLGALHLLLLDDDMGHGGLHDAQAAAITNGSGFATLFMDATILEGSFGLAVHRDPANGVSAAQPFTILVRSTEADYLAGNAAGWAGPLLPMSSLHSDPVNVPEPTQLSGDAAQFVNFSLENKTSRDAASVITSMRVDGVHRANLAQSPLPGPSTSPFLNFSLGVVTGGRHTVGAFVDSRGLVTEENEVNNKFADQWVFLPSELAIGTSQVRSSPPDPIGGWDALASGALSLNCDGIRIPSPQPIGEDGHWLAFAAMPGVQCDVDVRLHETATDARTGFHAFHVASDTGPDELEFVATNFRVTSPRTMDVGIVNVQGTAGYTANVVESKFLASVPLGTYGDFDLADGTLVALHEVQLTRGVLDLQLEHVAGTTDWGLTVLRASVAHQSRSDRDWSVESFLAGPASDEAVSFTIPESGYYCVAVWRNGPSSMTGTGTYRLHFGPTTPIPTGTTPTISPTRLANVRPNPFNPAAAIEFELARAGRVRLDIFDVRGVRVRSLLDAHLAAGSHARMWNGRDDRGTLLSSGVFYARLVAGTVRDQRKLLLLK